MIGVRFVCIGFLMAVILASCHQPQVQQAGQTKAAQEIAVTIDTGKTGEPISKYIYGQFIEHLGRCIYGGIWAEMLEDRKFYYPITDDFEPWTTASDRNWKAGPFKYLKASPWQVIGPAGTVTMDSNDAYVGEHSPVIHLPGDGSAAGICQDGLAVVKGKNYAGRIILAGDAETLPISVRLVLDNGEVLTEQIDKISSEFQTYPIEFTAPASSENVRIEIISTGKGEFKTGTLSLMPADNIRGWRRDVVALLKELDSPIYRWPGGNFVSGYNWRDGIGPRDKRPPRKNPAWKGIEHNDVGIHEYMELMELLGAEAFIAVNTGLGTVGEAAEEVEYCNGSTDTAMGEQRGRNGHPEPFNVKWWAVGNEMYGLWQLGHMPLEEYVKKHNCVAEAMWNVDRSIKLVAVGEAGKWSETMLKECSGHMNLISEHIYCKERRDVIEHTRQLSRQIRHKANVHRRYRRQIEELSDKDIRIAMDEWNFWYGDYVYGELGVRYHHKDALGVAIGLHEYFRNSDMYFMANYAQTVNVIGCIKTSRTDAAFATTALPLELYRHHFGTIPVEVTGGVSPLDISAAWTGDKKALTIGIVNPAEREYELAMDLQGVKLVGTGMLWLIAHSDPMAYNEPGKKPEVVIEEKSLSDVSGTLNVPPLSISLYKLTTK